MLAHRVGLVRRDLAHERRRRARAIRGASSSSRSIASVPDGPDTSARRGSYAATSSGRSATSCSAMYGGFDTISRSEPRSRAGSGSNHSPAARDPHARRRAAGDVRARDRERVVAHVGRPDLDVGQLRRERDRDRTGTGPDVDRGHAARAARPARAGAATGADPTAPPPPTRPRRRTPSPGRGISTRRSTNRSSPRNSHPPSTYCNGSPATRRAHHLAQLALARARAASRRRCRATRPRRSPTRARR